MTEPNPHSPEHMVRREIASALDERKAVQQADVEAVGRKRERDRVRVQLEALKRSLAALDQQARAGLPAMTQSWGGIHRLGQQRELMRALADVLQERLEHDL